MDDRQLIEKILARDEQAFRILIEKHKKLVYSTIYRIVPNQCDAEDLFQDVFFEVYRSIHHLRNDNDLSGWLFKIATNKSISFHRKKNPAKANTGNTEQTPLNMVQSQLKYSDKETPAQKLEQAEATQILFSAIDQLPEMQKKVLLMHKFEDYSHLQICTELNLTQASVESLIYRAKFSLRKSLYMYFKKHLK
jgi:RNA polymerase sigma-70 factor (ECF subfamily)